ncbi:MAG TPA: lytic transglycosylase domain-containing protein [Candidatus Paenibacillus intestinavium]|nr:lytic transglycosylase domain-containing protein [Candidatus Paenibacillus intestinavium]
MKRKKFRRRLLLLVVICFIIFLFGKSDWMMQKLYPVKYSDLIVESSEKYKVDPHLIAAVIRVETNFQTGRESPKGAVGLMQLMPTTSEWIVERANLEHISADKLLHDPTMSIELGTWYLNHLLDQFDGEKIVAIAAYNAGPGNVSKWIEQGTWSGEYATSDDIPFGETRRYVQKVVYYYNKYKELYPQL